MFDIEWLWLGLACLVGCAHGVPVVDPQDAVSSNDSTALIGSPGCGGLTTGAMVCRKAEGDDATKDYLEFYGPKTECDSDACVFVKVLSNKGQVIYGNSIAKGQTSKRVAFSVLLGKDKFEVGQHGLYGVIYTILYQDRKGEERRTFTEGYIFLRVLRKGYVSLHNSRDDEHFVWSWREQDRIIKMTTGGRVFVGPLQ